MSMLRRNRREHGASLVEFALILPMLALLLFGTITGGLSLSRQNSVKNAVREASRFAAVSNVDFDAPADALDAIYEQLVASATGDLDPGVDNRQICVAVIESATDGGSWFYQTYGSTSSGTSGSGAAGSGPGICTEDFDATVAADHARIWISAERTSEVSAILYADDWTLSAHALTRYER